MLTISGFLFSSSSVNINKADIIKPIINVPYKSPRKKRCKDFCSHTNPIELKKLLSFLRNSQVTNKAAPVPAMPYTNRSQEGGNNVGSMDPTRKRNSKKIPQKSIALKKAFGRESILPDIIDRIGMFSFKSAD